MHQKFFFFFFSKSDYNKRMQLLSYFFGWFLCEYFYLNISILYIFIHFLFCALKEIVDLCPQLFIFLFLFFLFFGVCLILDRFLLIGPLVSKTFHAKRHNMELLYFYLCFVFWDLCCVGVRSRPVSCLIGFAQILGPLQLHLQALCANLKAVHCLYGRIS